MMDALRSCVEKYKANDHIAFLHSIVFFFSSTLNKFLRDMVVLLLLCPITSKVLFVRSCILLNQILLRDCIYWLQTYTFVYFADRNLQEVRLLFSFNASSYRVC